MLNNAARFNVLPAGWVNIIKVGDHWEFWACPGVLDDGTGNLEFTYADEGTEVLSVARVNGYERTEFVGARTAAALAVRDLAAYFPEVAKLINPRLVTE